MKNVKLNIPLIYIIIGLLWIMFTNLGVLSIADRSQEPTLLRFLLWGKGAFFILLTGFLLHLLITREQKKIIRNDKQYREIYDNNPNPIWFYDPATYRFVAVNDAAIAGYGYSRNEFLSMTIMEIRPAEDLDKLKLAISRMQKNSHESGVWRHIKKDGSLIYVSTSSYQIMLDNKEVIMVLAVDDTEKVLYEMELQKVNAELLEQKQQLAANFAKQEHILNSITESFFTLDENHVITSANENFYQVTGLKQNVIGKTWEKVFPDSQGSTIYQQVEHAMELQQIVKVETYSEVLKKWLALSVYPEVHETTIYFSDITVAKEKDIQLKLALERYDIASRVTGEVIYDLDLKNNSLVFSKEITSLTNALPSQIGDSLQWWRSLVHPDDLEYLVLTQQEGTLSKEKYWNAEYRIKTGVNKYKYVYDQCHIILDGNRQPVRAIGALRDIDLLRRSVDQLKTMGDILNKISSSVIISDPQGEITWVNPVFTELKGYSSEEALGQSHTRFLSDVKTQQLRVEQIESAMVNKETFSAELQNYTRDDKEYWVTLNLSPIFDVKGELECYISVENDITERKDKEAQIDLQNEKLKAVSWLNSHQLRKPVASIMALSALMKMTDDPEEKEELFDLLCACTTELDQIIHQINAEASGKGVS